MSKSLNLVNQTFGRLTVVSKSTERSSSGSIKWECLCSCGKSILVRTDSLKNGHTLSCGCFNKEQSSLKNTIDLTGKVFGRLTVLRLDTKTAKYGEPYCICECSCGNIKSIIRGSLSKGLVRSCGCLSTETKRRLTIIRNESYRLKYGLKEPTLVAKLRQKHKKLRNNVLQRDGNSCVLCGSSNELHMHHIVPLCHAELDTVDNLVTLCRVCHESRAHNFHHRSVIDEAVQAFLISYITTFRDTSLDLVEDSIES